MKAVVAVLTLAAASLGADRLMEGNPSSPVRVIIYEDLQCPDCADFRVMLDTQILPKYSAKAAFEHRDFPLPKHAWARRAAVASRHFYGVKPELAIEWRRYAMANLRDITPENFNDKLSTWATARGADGAAAVAALRDKTLDAAVEEDYQDGVARGIAHTPTVLVDGEPFIETFTFEEIARSIDKATGGK